jgi:hypothetical protein
MFCQRKHLRRPNSAISDNSQYSADRIRKPVQNVAGSGRNEILMDFIRRAVHGSCDNAQNHRRADAIFQPRIFECPEKQNADRGIRRKMNYLVKMRNAQFVSPFERRWRRRKKEYHAAVQHQRQNTKRKISEIVCFHVRAESIMKGAIQVNEFDSN